MLEIIRKQLTKIIKKYWPVILLFSYGMFIILINSEGSLNGDEAIYSQVSKETLAQHSWLTLYWREKVWLEKSPFFVWLQMISILYFGYGEVVLRFISGLFGIFTAVLVYFVANNFFRDRRGSFLAGIVVLSTPFFVDSMRSAMTDTMVTFFIFLAFFAWYKSFRRVAWLNVYFVSAGLAIMTKSVVGIISFLLPLGVFIFSKSTRIYYWNNRKSIMKGIFLLLLIVLPWHIFMSWKFGGEFWQNYLGYHIIDRFRENIIESYCNNYWNVIWNRFGIWPIVFLVILGMVKKNIVIKYRKEILYLLGEIVLIIIFFSLAKTKSPHYILPIVPFVAVIIGGLVGVMLRWRQKTVIVLGIVSLFNFFPLFVLKVSDYGLSNLLWSQVGWHFFRNNQQVLYSLLLGYSIVFLYFGWKSYYKKTNIINNIVFVMLVGLNIFIPFSPDKDPEMKKVGKVIANIYKNNFDYQNIKYVFMTKDNYHRTNTLLFYLPIGMQTERIRLEDAKLLQNNRNNSLCIILHNKQDVEQFGKLLYRFKGGEVRECWR